MLHIFHDTSLGDPAWKPLPLRGRGFHAGRLVKYHGKYATTMWFCFSVIQMFLHKLVSLICFNTCLGQKSNTRLLLTLWQIWHYHEIYTLQRRHNGRDGVPIHQHHCLLNRLFRCRSKKTSKLRVIGLCAGNSPVTGDFSAQVASNAGTIWWCRRELFQWHVILRYPTELFSSAPLWTSLFTLLLEKIFRMFWLGIVFSIVLVHGTHLKCHESEYHLTVPKQIGTDVFCIDWDMTGITTYSAVPL